MSTPPIYHLNDLGPQAQAMARNCDNQRLAMVLQYVAIGSMIVMTGAAAAQILKDCFGTRDHDRGRSPLRRIWKRSRRTPGRPVAGNQLFMMVPDHGEETAGLATTFTIPTRPSQYA
jgi:hypothetical protein